MRRAARASLPDLFDDAIEIRVASAKFTREPVPTPLRNPLAVRDHLELSGLTGGKDRLNAQALLDESHETRDLDLIVLSRRAVNDFNLHSFSPICFV